MKMALQYFMACSSHDGDNDDLQKTKKNKFISMRKGYHGDTAGAMSVCDPETGMHHIFQSMLTKQIFVPPPMTPYPHSSSSSSISSSSSGTTLDPKDKKALDQVFDQHHSETAAFILEPIVQGAGGMRI